MRDFTRIRALLAEAWSLRRQERYDEALKITDEVKELCRPEDHIILGRVYHLYMQFASDKDLLEKAIGYSKLSVHHYKESGITDRMAHSIRHLADLLRRSGDLEGAGQAYKSVLKIYRGKSDTHDSDLANTLRGYALLLEAMGNRQEALGIWAETRDRYALCGIDEGVKEANGHLDELTKN